MKIVLILFFMVASFQASAGAWRNYADSASPIYQASFGNSSAPEHDGFRVASLNINFAKNLTELAKEIKTNSHFHYADVILLQEVVGEPGDSESNSAAILARELGLNYVYVPDFIHQKNGKDFGVSILSPHPLLDVKKIILPHPHFLYHTQRVAVGATVSTPHGPVRAYSIHAETLQWMSWRKDQIDTVFSDALAFDSMPVVFGGDFNSAPFWQRHFITHHAEKMGWNVSTKKVKGATFTTIGHFRMRLDHILDQRLQVLDAGKIPSSLISDHDALWASFKKID